CLKCLRKEPERRYASAAELADDLGRYQRGEPIRARPVGGAEWAAKWVRRNPVLTAAALAVVLTIVLGTTLSYLKYLDAEAARKVADDRADERDAARKDAVRDAAEAKKQARLAHTALHVFQIDQALQAGLRLEHPRMGKLLTEMRPEYHQTWGRRYARNL